MGFNSGFKGLMKTAAVQSALPLIYLAKYGERESEDSSSSHIITFRYDEL
jgi:hypothetical protein